MNPPIATDAPERNGRRRTTRASSARRRVRPPQSQSPTPAGFVMLAALIVLLNLIGMVMVLSASSVEALRDYGSSWFFFKRQILWLAGGTIALLVGMRIDYRRWRRFSLPALVVSSALLVLVLIPGLGISVYGSRRWLGVGMLRMQPSEMAKLALILFVADLLVRRSAKMAEPRLTLSPVMAVLAGMAGLVVIEPDMGTAMVMVAAVFAVLFVAGVPLGPLAKVSVLGTGVAFFFMRLEPYRWARIVSFRDPMADADGVGYQLAQSLVGLGSGGITGVGLGASRAKHGFLPHSHTDFIFAVVGEELGLLGAVMIVMLFAAFAFLGIRAAMRAPDRYGMLLATGITALIASQAFINIGAVIGLLPVTGVPLPFISFGGSSLLVTMAASGMLLNIARVGRPRTQPQRG